MLALKSSYKEIARFLMNPDINHKAKDGTIDLIIALNKGYKDTVNLLNRMTLNTNTKAKDDKLLDSIIQGNLSKNGRHK